jgi:hypothetical protein
MIVLDRYKQHVPGRDLIKAESFSWFRIVLNFQSIRKLCTIKLCLLEDMYLMKLMLQRFTDIYQF